MDDGNISKSYYSNQDIIKATIKFVLYRHGKLTAKDIQEKTGLKRQTTYNYLKKMVDDESLDIEYEPKEGKPYWNITYYKIRRKDNSEEKKDISYTEKVKRRDKDWLERRKTILEILNLNMAALIEARTFIHNLTIEEFRDYILMKPDIWGTFTSIFLLTDEEYTNLQSKFKEFMNEYMKSANTDSNAVKGKNVFLYSFLRDFSL